MQLDNFKIMHRSLICCSNLDYGDWMVEVRKTYYKDDYLLKLELKSFSPDGEIRDMGSLEIASF